MDNDIERSVRLALFEEAQRKRDRRRARLQTIAMWIGALAAVASPWIIVALSR